MHKTLIVGIVGLGLLAGCGGGSGTTSTSTSTALTPTVLKSNSAASGSGYLTLTNNGTIETLVARGIDVDDITVEPAQITLNSLSLAQNYTDTTRYSGSVNINGTTVTGYVLTGKNQTTAQVLLPTNLSGSSLSSGLGQVVSSMPTGTHTYNGNSMYIAYAGGNGSGSTGVGYPMSVDVDISNGTGVITLNTAGTNYVETLALNSQTGSFNGLGDIDNNGESFTTFGNIVGQNGEAIVGVFNAIHVEPFVSGNRNDVLIGGYVAER